MIRLCGAALGFLAFGVTVFLGLSAGLPAEVILGRAISAMIVFCLLGLVTGWVASRVLDEHALRMSREMFTEVEEDEEESADPPGGGQAPNKNTGPR